MHLPRHIWNYIHVLWPRIIRVVTQSSGHLLMLYHIFGELLCLTPSPGNLMHFLSPQCNSNCSSHYSLSLAKFCWLWHSTHFLSLREIHSNPRLLIRTNILRGQHPIPCNPGRGINGEHWLEVSRELIQFSYSTITHCPAISLLCARFPSCKIRGLNLVSCGCFFTDSLECASLDP